MTARTGLDFKGATERMERALREIESDSHSPEEIEKIQKRMGLEQPKHKIDYAIGEVVNITDGPFKGFDGSINEIDPQKGKLKVLVNMFGRETPVELDSLQVKKI